MLYESSSNKYQPFLMTFTGSSARFCTRCNHFVVYEGYEVLYQRLRLGADNKSTKQSPIDRGNNINGNDDESIFHLVGIRQHYRYESRQESVTWLDRNSVRTDCCRTLKILSLVSNVDHGSDVRYRVLYFKISGSKGFSSGYH